MKKKKTLIYIIVYTVIPVICILLLFFLSLSFFDFLSSLDVCDFSTSKPEKSDENVKLILEKNIEILGKKKAKLLAKQQFAEQKSLVAHTAFQVTGSVAIGWGCLIILFLCLKLNGG